MGFACSQFLIEGFRQELPVPLKSVEIPRFEPGVVVHHLPVAVTRDKGDALDRQAYIEMTAGRLMADVMKREVIDVEMLSGTMKCSARVDFILGWQAIALHSSTEQTKAGKGDSSEADVLRVYDCTVDVCGMGQEQGET